MPLRITFLGSGGAFSDFRVNYHTNALVDTKKGPVLIDCGTTAVQSMKELRIPVWGLAGVLITHIHGDHVGGLEQLLWERYYTGPFRGPGFLPTPIYAPGKILASLRRVLHDCVDEIMDSDGVNKPGGFYLLTETTKVEPLTPPLEIGGVLFQFVPTQHVVGPAVDKPAFGILIGKWEGAQMAWAYWTGDTMFRPDIGDVAPQASVIFHDCSFLKPYPGSPHAHYEQLKTLSPEIRAKIVIMHHTTVPPGIDVVHDGFKGAATRHATYEVFPCS